MRGKLFKQLFQISQPILLLAGIGQFFLGAGIAKYLGNTMDWGIFWLGLAWVLSVQWVSHLLLDYFESPKTENKNKLTDESKRIFIGTALSFVAIFLVFLIRSGNLNVPAGIVIFILFFLGFFFVLRPIRLIYSGFGELSIAIAFGNLIPSFSYLLQDGEMNRLVMIISFPLIFLILSLILAMEFPNYASDIKNSRNTILVRLGWENGMFMHNTFVLIAFLILGLAGVFGLPSAIIFPAFLPFPLALLQLWHMRQINLGEKPNWRFLRLNAVVMVVLMSYILTNIFWIR